MPDSTFGPNAWLVDEMYERYRADPASVSESWQDFFNDYEPAENGEAEPRTEPIDTAEPVEEPKAPEKAEKKAAKAPDQKEKEKQPAKQAPGPEPAEVLRGAAARVVANMEASLAVPT